MTQTEIATLKIECVKTAIALIGDNIALVKDGQVIEIANKIYEFAIK